MTSTAKAERRDAPAFNKGKTGVLEANRKDEEPPPAGQGFELGVPAQRFGLELLFLELVISRGVLKG